MGLESFQARAHDTLGKKSPSRVSSSADRPLDQNENNVDDSQEQTPHRTANSSLLPPLTRDESSISHFVPSHVQRAGVPESRSYTSPQNIPQYRNVYNDRARRGFCYWLVEKKSPTCKGYSFGAYKTCLGLPKV